MARSSGTPRGRGLGAITKVMRGRLQATTISRPSETLGDLDQTETTTSTHQEDLWVFDPMKSVGETVAGERLTGDLAALGLDGIDVAKDDRITHGGVEYEVDTVTGYPSDADADGTTHGNTRYFTISLVRRDAP